MFVGLNFEYDFIDRVRDAKREIRQKWNKISRRRTQNKNLCHVPILSSLLIDSNSCPPRAEEMQKIHLKNPIIGGKKKII